MMGSEAAIDMSSVNASGVIWWPTICGNETLYDAFWSNDLSISTHHPDVTYCFEATVLTWVPAIYLILTAFIFIPYCRSFPNVNAWSETSVIHAMKMLLTLVLLVLAVSNYLQSEPWNTGSFLQDLQPFLVKSLTMLSVLFYTQWTFRKGFHTSGVLLTFWFIQVTCDAIRFVSYIHRQEVGIGNKPDWWYDVFYGNFTLEVMLFVICLPSDLGAHRHHRRKDGHSDKDNGLTEKQHKDEEKPCPYYEASFASNVFFCWVNRFVYTGYKRVITYADIWDIREEDSCEIVVNTFLRHWEEQLTQAGYSRSPGGSFLYDTHTETRPSLSWALAKSFWYPCLAAGVMLLTSSVLIVVIPLFIDLLIQFVMYGDPYTWHGYVYALIMSIVSVVCAQLWQHYQHQSIIVGMRTKSALTGAIYRKSMRLSRASTFTTGAITNLISVDVQKLYEMHSCVHYVWVTPIVVAIGTYVLWFQVGAVSLAGTLFGAVFLLVAAFIAGGFMQKFQMKEMLIKDARIKLTNQVISGMKVLKLYGWEPEFEERICKMRDEELDNRRGAGMAGCVIMCYTFASGFLASLLIFTIYIFMIGDGNLPADVAFVTISLLNVPAEPITLLPGAIMYLSQAVVSITRIATFLLEPELDPDDTEHVYEGAAVTVEDGSFSWGDTPVLKNLSFQVQSGSLVAVVGHVGSGKSSLISALLGEMLRCNGLVSVSGSTAYVPQEAWIQNMSLRDNILFDRPYNDYMYQRVIDNCCLVEDLKVFVGGDSIEIGERGINLSGGQKQRVALARACYQESDIYLLDDPLSTVDAHVGKHIFQNVIGPQGMLKSKTRILTTNSVAFLDQADLIIVLEDGRITECGPYDDLIAQDGSFASYVNTYSHSNGADTQTPPEGETTIGKSDRIRTLSGGSETKHEAAATRRHGGNSNESAALISEEDVETENIKLSVIMSYVKSGSCRWFTLVMIGFIVNFGGEVGYNIWLSIWSNDALLPPEEAHELMNLRLLVYAALGLVKCTGIVLVAFCVMMGTVTASRSLHHQLMGNVLKAPMLFFETNSKGRIINRFSKDMETLDVQMLPNIWILCLCLSSTLAYLVIISYTAPIFIAFIFPLIILFVVAQRLYTRTARQVKRVESVNQSPVFAIVADSLTGIDSIRAYRQEDRFIRTADTLVDKYTKCCFATVTSARWMGTFAKVVSVLVLLFAAIFCVVKQDTLDAGTVGLSLASALMVRVFLGSVLKASCDLETYIVAAERVHEYCQLPNEAPWYIPGQDPPPDWPNRGQISFHKLCLRYRPGLDLVLKGIDCAIFPGEKVGIVGRTGAGKSSMMAALFRMVEAASGAIVVDGQTISNIGLHDIRRNLTIMPQDPVVFSGSLRFNVDPSMASSDHALWEALQLAHLRDFAVGTGEGLDFECGENGQNMSMGQRQLLCLSRALLRKPKILVLDEATAAIDLETDDLIQETIRSGFQNCTILTIAHRLNTIMDYDRILVLDQGHVAEFDTPSSLLADEDSVFHNMAKDAGLA